MTRGIGIDIIEIDRVKHGAEKHGQPFLNRLFTQKEQEYCRLQSDPYPRFAGRFAAKEALAKALGCGFGSEVGWHDIEILPDSQGKPIVSLSSALKTRFNNPTIHLSISHSKTHATAVALVE